MVECSKRTLEYLTAGPLGPRGILWFLYDLDSL